MIPWFNKKSKKRRRKKKTTDVVLKKKIEFSKIIILCIGLIALSTVIFTFVMIYRTGDLTPLAYLIPAVFTELATATGFYYNKAKAENKLKILKQEGPEVFDKLNNNTGMMNDTMGNFNGTDNMNI